MELDVEVDEKGNVVSAKAINGPPVLMPSAEEALKKWLFKPATRDGLNVRSVLRVEVVFNP